MSAPMKERDWVGRLGHLGLLNHDQEDFGNVQSLSKYNFQRRAFCNSNWCIPVDENGKKRKNPKPVQKLNVKETDSVCPDCGYCLFWENVRKK